ncbi:MAG: CpsD/CapB family tyrosine-protein kinase [Planctomycetes bacterium]|nr:CpsD/CapB family tyrosine-protein kinase [Planctomycetota bacterium]
MFPFRKKRVEEALVPPNPAEDRAIELTSEELRLLRQPRSAIAEQIRQLRNSIQALNPDGAPRTMVITSSVEGEGKSVGTLNLALALAELPRMRVLVLDADLHRPAIEDYLGLPHRQGLSELLRGELGLDQAVRATSVQGLCVMGPGRLPEKPSELLGSDRLKTVLSQLRQRFDYVLIDTPPALSINDSAMLGALADGIVLVVRMHSTQRHLVEQAYNLLENLGGNVLGTLLTAAGEPNQAYSR